MKYDYLIVGSGLYGAVFAHEAKKKGKSVLVVEKRSHIGGNIYTENTEGINVHVYGAHIFHTNEKKVWDYITKFADFNRFTNSPVANYHGELYSMPFNMYTFTKMWGVVTPEEAESKIKEQREEITGTPKNLEEQAISLVGRDIFEKLVKGYTEKQWGRDCKDLPAFIIKRLPVRFTFDNNYFNALYQGIPIGGYTKIIEKLLEGIEVRLNTDYLVHKQDLDNLAETIVYTGPIDAYFDYKLGALEYRSLRFETEVLEIPNFQGNAAVNYTDKETPWTRIIEHKWFEFGKDEDGNELPKTVISREYSSEWKIGDEPYYPVNDEKNNKIYDEYKKLAEGEKNVIFGGRLGEYKYYDMDQVIGAALEKSNEVLNSDLITKEDLDNIWNYYLMLEKDLDNTSRYVEPKGQENTASFEFDRLLLLSCTEVESVFIILCKLISDKKLEHGIADYKEIILNRFPNIVNVDVDIPRLGRCIKPFDNWDKGPLDWWNSYQKVKHCRKDNFELASYKNACTTLAALHVLILYLCKVMKENINNYQGNYIKNSFGNEFAIIAETTEVKFPDFDYDD